MRIIGLGLFVAGVLLVVITVQGAAKLAAVSLNARTWDIQYSVNTPRHPSSLKGMSGWSFDFPGAGGYVAYVTTPYATSIANAATVSFTAQTVATSGVPSFNYQTEPENTCTFPAHARVYLEHANIDWNNPSHRYWSNPIAFELDTYGPGTFSTSLTAEQWSNVNGVFGSSDLPGWIDLVNNIGRVGLTFGGGCFFGHGVYVTGGTARFVLTNYSIQ